MSNTPHTPVHIPKEWTDPTDYNPFDEVEVLPGLGIRSCGWCCPMCLCT